MTYDPVAPVAQHGSSTPARVLIVDDDPTMVALCARTLTAAGHEAVVATDTASALEALRAQAPFDLLLADIQLPGASGLELAQAARELDPAIAVVIMTGHSSMDTLHASVRRGVADYLTKPFEIDELRTAIDQALHKRHLLQESLRMRALEQLLQSSEAMNAILDREQLARTIVQHARAHLPCHAGFLIIAGSTDTPTEVVTDPEHASLLASGREAVAQSIRAGRPLAVRDETPLATAGEHSLTHGLAVPLRSRGEVVGAILLCDNRPDFASPGAQEILALLANQAGNALRNAHLYAELDTAFKALRELDRLKSEFIAIASHELRSPLSIVMGYARMVRDRSDGELHAYAQRMLDGAERIKGIVDDMMRLRDLDRNQARMSTAPTALGDLVAQAVERLAPSAQQKQLAVDLRVPEAPLVVELDPDKALLVIGNLLANAIKFTPAGGSVTITLDRWPHERLATAVGRATSNPTVRRLKGAIPPEWAVVRVEDTGIGIPRDQQARIFDRFYQVASSLTREHGGAGLGLAIVCDLTTLLGGVVWVESEEGRGSTFSFALPLGR